MSRAEIRGNFGVDKLKLFTSNFQVNDKQPLEIVPNRKKAGSLSIEETPLFMLGSEQVTGERAYINADNYTLKIEKGLFWMEYNPSKYYDPVKLTSDPNQIAESLNTIQSEILNKYKIEVDLLNTGISRIDMTAQSEMKGICKDYYKIISAGKKSLRFNKTDYPSAFLLGNGARQIMTYDKGLQSQVQQQRLRNINKPSALKESNFLRLETRLLKAESVKAHSQFKNISHLLDAEKSKYFHLYSKCVGDLLRIEQPEIEFVEMNTLTDFIKTTYTTSKRGQWLPILFATFGNDIPNTETFSKALKRLEDEEIIQRQQSWKMLRQYEKTYNLSRFLRDKYLQDSSDNYTNMFNEIHTKFIQPFQIAI